MSDNSTPEDANAECVGPNSTTAGRASSCEGCPNQSACAARSDPNAPKEIDKTTLEVAQRLSKVKHKLLVLSGKGGCGKSTVAAQLAWTLAARGFQIGLLDIDVCGPSMPRMMGIENEEVRSSGSGWSPVFAKAGPGLAAASGEAAAEIPAMFADHYVPGTVMDNLEVMSIGFLLKSNQDAVIWRGPRKNALIQQFLCEVDWGELDFLIIDAPPGTSDEHITITQLLGQAEELIQSKAEPNTLESSFGSLIVTTPQEIALLDVRKEITFCRKTSVPIFGIVENMAGFKCPCCTTISPIFAPLTGGAKALSEQMNVPLLTSIPLDPLLLQSCEAGICFAAHYPNSSATGPILDLVEKLSTSHPAIAKTFESIKTA